MAGIFVLALSGRYEVEILGWTVGVRFIIGWAVAMGMFFWLAALRPRGSPKLSGATVLMLLLFVVHMASVAWSVEGARRSDVLLNDLIMLGLIASTALLVSVEPRRARAALVWCMYGAGIIFVLGSALTGATSGVGRAVAFGGGPNVYARIVFWGAIASVGIALKRQSWRWLIPLPFLVLFGVLAGSRGALLAMVVTLIFVLFINLSAIRPRHLIGGVFFGGLTTALVLRDERVQYLMERRLNWDQLNASGLSGREDLWALGSSIFNENPVGGLGMDSFNALYGRVSGFPYPHNLVLEVAGDLGLIGLTVLGSVAVAAYRDMSQVWPTSDTYYRLLVASALFTFSASQFSGDLYDSRFLWIYLAATCARVEPRLRIVRKADAKSAPSTRREEP